MFAPLAIPEQSASGAFVSLVHRPLGATLDENSFVTALVCEALYPWRAQPKVALALKAGLDYLEQCASTQIRGAFGFWPEGRHPDWIARALPPDVDDTALCHSVLGLYGRSVGFSMDSFAAIANARCSYLDERNQPWHRLGVYETWLGQAGAANPIDLTVNVNVLAMAERVALPLAGSRAIRDMLHQSLAWAGAKKARLGVLTPWYPQPIEILFALERAARLGVGGLGSYITTLRSQIWVQSDLASGDNLPVCGSSDKRFTWYCKGLGALRGIRHAIS